MRRRQRRRLRRTYRGATALIAIFGAAALGFSSLRGGSAAHRQAPYVRPSAVSAVQFDREVEAANATWQHDVDVLTYTAAYNAHQQELYLQEVARQEAERAEAERSALALSLRGGNTARQAAGGGGCGVPPDDGEAPAGFPSGVIQKESSGDRSASNGSHFGRAQLSCEHYASGGGCVGLSYSECWSKLWAGGAGASNWAQTIG